MKHIDGKRVIRQCFDQLTLVIEFFPEDSDQSDAHGNGYEGFPYRKSRALPGQPSLKCSRVSAFSGDYYQRQPKDEAQNDAVD